MKASPFLVILCLLLTVGSVSASVTLNASAHTMLTDGNRATSNPDDSRWLTLYADSTELPKTHYDLGEFCFWGINAPMHLSPTGNPGLFELLKEGNLLGVRYEFSWEAMNQTDQIRHDISGLEEHINLYRENGFSIIGLVSYTPAWVSGHRGRTGPPIASVEGEIIDPIEGYGYLQHKPLVYTPLVLSENPSTVSIQDEIVANNYTHGQVPQTEFSPIDTESTQIWVDENDGRGWVKWQVVERLLDSPNGAEHCMVDFRGRIMFRNNTFYRDRGKVPAQGSRVKVTYDYYAPKYELGVDYTYDHVDGRLLIAEGEISVSIDNEQFTSLELNDQWEWMNEPVSWNVGITTQDNLHIEISPESSAGEIGNYLYQNAYGVGDFSVHLRVSDRDWKYNQTHAQVGIMIYHDSNNWFRYGMSNNLGRPLLVRRINGVTTVYGNGGQLGFGIFPPRWINIRKTGNTYTVFTSNNSLLSPEGGSGNISYTFDMELKYPLKVGVSTVGHSQVHPEGRDKVDIDQFILKTPNIKTDEPLKVYYEHLNTNIWQEYLKSITNYYMDRVKYWEIWNEPDQYWCWSGTQHHMAFMVKSAYQAIKEIDRTANISGPGYANLEAARLWYSVIYETIGNQYMNALAWHPYLFSNRSPDVWGWSGDPAIRNIMIQQGDADKQVFYTEISTTSGVLCWGGGNNERRQADFAMRLGMFARRQGWVKGMQWWPAVDLEPVGIREDFGYGGHDGLFYNHSVNAQSASRTNNIVTVITESPHLYRPGDKIFFRPKTSFGASTREIISVPTPNSFTFSFPGPDAGSFWLEERRINGLFPKPAYWTYRHAASNQGVLLDLVNYDSGDNPVPTSRKHTINRVTIGAQNRAAISAIRIMTSLTATDNSSRPRRVAARHIGQAGKGPFVVDIEIGSQSLVSEKWTVTATSPTAFSVVGEISGSQGTAAPGTQFTSANGVVKFTVPSGGTPYIAGDRFEFETFAGDGFTEAVTWQNNGTLTGAGDITINLPQSIDARYVSIHFVRAPGATSIKVDEIGVYNTQNNNVSQGKLYVVDGYQEYFMPEYVPPPVDPGPGDPDPGDPDPGDPDPGDPDPGDPDPGDPDPGDPDPGDPDPGDPDPGDPDPGPTGTPLLRLTMMGMPTEPIPGAVVDLTVHYENISQYSAAQVVINCPVPENTTFVSGSATSGGVYDQEADLVRWVMPTIVAGGSGQVSFKVRID